jgi:hypothetical protein
MSIENLRAYAKSDTEIVLRWADEDEIDVDVYRSIDDITYTLVEAVDGSELEFIDSELEAGIRYYYKLTQDDGDTYTSVVSTFTHTCANVSSVPLHSVPRFDGVEQQPDRLNDLAARVEQNLNQTTFVGSSSPSPLDQCDACIVEGRLILDCSLGCDSFRVEATEDISSISVIGCGSCPPVDFIIPANVTRLICGWPVNCDYEGDECFDGPISGGPNGRIAKTNGLSYSPGGGFLTNQCPCSLVSGLNIKCCSKVCEFSCAAQNSIKLKACGGRAPYTWEVTENGLLSNATGQTTTVRIAPVNPNTAGVGYARVGVRMWSGHYPNIIAYYGVFVQYLDCNGNVLSNLTDPYGTFGGGTIHCNGTPPFACGAIRFDSVVLNNVTTCYDHSEGSLGPIDIHVTDTNTGHTLSTTVDGWCEDQSAGSGPDGCYFCKDYPCTQCVGQTIPCLDGGAYRQCRDYLGSGTLDLRAGGSGCDTDCPEGEDITVTVTDADSNSVSVNIPVGV